MIKRPFPCHPSLPHVLHDGLELRLAQAGLLGQVGQDVGQQVVDGGGALRPWGLGGQRSAEAVSARGH